MTGINHIITGGLIGALVPQPLIAIPLAFASHFLLDMLPHYGDHPSDHLHASNHIRRIVRIDTWMGVLFFGALLLLRPPHWPSMMLAAAAALLPDLMWLPNYIRALRGQDQKPYNFMMRFHKRIQWAEKRSPFHAGIEAGWFVTATVLFLRAGRFWG